MCCIHRYGRYRISWFPTAFTQHQLQFYVAGAEAGSVPGAAQALSISQSSVTEAIRGLEEDLGGFLSQTSMMPREGL